MKSRARRMNDKAWLVWKILLTQKQRNSFGLIGFSRKKTPVYNVGLAFWCPNRIIRGDVPRLSKYFFTFVAKRLDFFCGHLKRGTGGRPRAGKRQLAGSKLLAGLDPPVRGWDGFHLKKNPRGGSLRYSHVYLLILTGLV